MKTIKAWVRVVQDENSTSYEYPRLWLDNATSIPSVIYPKDRSGQQDIGGQPHQLVYFVADDALASRLVSECGYEETTKAETAVYAETNSPRLPVVVDQNKVTGILAKSALGQELSQKEMDALDPENPEPGINKQPSWLETLTGLGL